MHSPTRTTPLTPAITSARLARAVLGYLTLNIAVITLAPFRFSMTPVNGLTSIFGVRDAILNVVLFLPLGFVFQLSRERREEARWLTAFGAGLLVSGMIETAQVFAPGRYPSLSDLLTNALGAALGAWVASLAVQRTNETRTVRAFALDLPLIGLTYLLLPVLWLTGLSSSEGGQWALLLPLISAAWIMGSVHASYGSPFPTEAERDRVLRLGSGATLFVAVGVAPAAQADLSLLLAGALLFAAFIVLRVTAPAAWTVGRMPDGSISRRFEGPTLRVALAPLLAFVVVVSLAPVTGDFSAWQGTWALTRGSNVPTDAALYRAMAVLAAYTAIGYGIAATNGRRVESLRGLAMRAFGWSLALAIPVEWLRGWGTTTAASFTMLTMTSVASVLGAGIYQLQLRHIQTLLGRR
jgi:VanZ family protein